ncbi:MAG TPA: ABC transporter permease [Gammaproteobacteria bacterium]|nr:ABC transporter permease [Gammaproteobacteria bacterium]
MSAIPRQFEDADFEPAAAVREAQVLARPAQTYWQDASRRLRKNRRAMASLWIVAALALFAIAGPWLWRVDPAAQDVERANQPPSLLPETATIVAPHTVWPGVLAAASGTAEGAVPDGLRLAQPATTQAVRLAWNAAPGAAGYRVYRNLYDPAPDRALGLPMASILNPQQVSFEDRLNLEPRRYWYSVVALDREGNETAGYAVLAVRLERAVSARDAQGNGWIASAGAVKIGDVIRLPYHPLGTDYLGRDMLSRLMHGARVSLFIGVVAPLLYVLGGVVYGSAAGFLGGRTDQLLMRFADFVVALPFLLFMILFKIAFGIGPGESGIVPMLVALVLLSWPATARLVRGQILQIRQEGYISASRLLGARTGYLIFRHMIPNTLGVVLVTLTFAVPSVIFTEAFLSFIGMGVAPPTPSWGSMSNDGIRTLLTHPHELILPAVFISIAVLAFNLLGDGLRDALDVRMRGRE